MKKEYPQLFHKGKKGEIRVWKVWAENGEVFTEHGLKDGKMTPSSFKVEQKNVGKANETSLVEQAEIEAKALWVKKQNTKYFLTEEECLEGRVLPMTAKELRINKVEDVFYLERKLDGNRLLCFWEDDKVILRSRGGKVFENLWEIKTELEQFLPKNCMIDGEIYTHGVGVQTLNSRIKDRKEGSELLQMWVYDFICLDAIDESFETRVQKKDAFFQINNFKNLVKLDSLRVVKSEVSGDLFTFLKEIEDGYVQEGYEGAILRNASGKYLFGYRSDDLMKIKSFEDREFIVLDVTDGKGKFEGKACFICQNDIADNTFECTMATSMENKAKQLQEKDKYIGKKLTVKFQGRTDADKPKFATGKCFRLEEDLS